MKKIFIIIFLSLFICGCSDYKELTDLTIISGINISYKDNNYNLTFEILEDNKNSFIEGSGKSIKDAFNNIEMKINKIPFYSHLNILSISSNTSDENIKEIVVYLINNNDFTNQFYVIISDDNKISNKDIYEFIDNKKIHDDINLKVTFKDFLINYYDDNKSNYLPKFSINDNEIKLDGIVNYNENKVIK